MKKTTLAKLLGLSCAICLVGGAVTVGNVNTVSADEVSTLVPDAEWTDPWGTGAQYQYDTATGTSYVRMTSWGQRAYNVNKVKLDGLKVTMASTQHASGHRFGFGFTGNTNNDYTLSEMTTVNVTWVAYQYDGQNRLYVNSNHADGTICYRDQALTNNSGVFGLDQSFVAMATADDAYSFTFDLVVDNEGTDTDVWSVTVAVVRGAKHEMQTAPCTVYFSGAKMPNILDENGECYVSAWGMENAGAFSLKLEDDNQRAYVANTLENAKTVAADYIALATEANDLAGFKAAMEKKAALETAIASLRGNDKAAYNAKLAEGNAIIEGKQDVVKGIVLEEYNKVAAATAVFEDENAITADSIAAATTALDAANAVYADAENLLNDENKTYFADLAKDYAYDIDYAKAALSVIACESKVEGIETLEEAALLQVIAEVRATYANYEGSEMQTLINALNETDKAAMEARLMALVTVAEEAATAQKDSVKAKYEAVKAAVEALEADASQEKVDAAETALDEADAKYALVKELFTEEEQAAYDALTLDYSARIAVVEEELNKETPDPDDSSSSETPDPDDSSSSETPDPDDSSSSETPDPDDSSSSETPDPNDSSSSDTAEKPDDSDEEKPTTAMDEVIATLKNALTEVKQMAGCASTVGGISTVVTLIAAAIFVLKKKD